MELLAEKLPYCFITQMIWFFKQNEEFKSSGGIVIVSNFAPTNFFFGVHCNTMLLLKETDLQCEIHKETKHKSPL